jgi:uncharacterized cupin superfamily protein
VTIPIVTATAAAVDLEPAPITPAWILSGKPEASNKILTFSEDRTSYVMVWECTPGRFNWIYDQDETVVFVSGEVFITMQTGLESRLGTGDMVFFPAGSSATWRITSTVRKVAVMRNALPQPFVVALRVWNKVRAIAGMKPKAPAVRQRALVPGAM